jgi:hypothetical protein
MKRPGVIIIFPVILLGIIGAAVAVISRESSDTNFVFRQQNLSPITPAVLQRFVASAPDPRPGTGRRRGSSARCSARGLGELRNPWVCTVSYPVGPSVRYRVIIDPNGQVHGVNGDGSLTVYGCCVGYRPSQ